MAKNFEGGDQAKVLDEFGELFNFGADPCNVASYESLAQIMTEKVDEAEISSEQEKLSSLEPDNGF